MSSVAAVEFRSANGSVSLHNVVVLPNHSADDVSLRLAIKVGSLAWRSGQLLWRGAEGGEETPVPRSDKVLPLLKKKNQLVFVSSAEETNAAAAATEAVIAVPAAVAPVQNEGEIAELKEELEEAKKELEEAKQEAEKELSQAKEDAARELSEAKEALEKEIADAKASWQSEVDELKKELADTKAEAEKEADSLRKQLEEAASGVVSVPSESPAVALSDSGSEKHVAQLAEALARIAVLEKERDEAAEAAARRANQAEDLLSEMTVLKQRFPAFTAGPLTKEQIAAAKAETARLEELERIARGEGGSSSEADRDRVKREREAELVKLQTAALDKKRMFEEKAEQTVTGEREVTAEEKARRAELESMRTGIQAGSKKSFFDDAASAVAASVPLVSPTSAGAEKMRQQRAATLKSVVPLPAKAAPESAVSPQAAAEPMPKVRERRNTFDKLAAVSSSGAVPVTAEGTAVAATAAISSGDADEGASTAAVADQQQPSEKQPKRDSSSSSIPQLGGPAYNKEMNKNPKTAIAAAAANDPEYDILDLSGNTMFLMKHRDYAKELGGALAGNTYIREVHLKSVDLDKVDVQSLMEGLVKNSTVVLLDLEKNKIDNEGAATLANMMRQNSTIREVNLFGQAGRAFGDACLTAFVDMFTYNVTLTKIIWRLDSRKSFAINKLLVRNNTIKKNLEEGRDVSKIVPEHCNIPELLSKRAVGASAAVEDADEEANTNAGPEEDAGTSAEAPEAAEAPQKAESAPAIVQAAPKPSQLRREAAVTSSPAMKRENSVSAVQASGAASTNSPALKRDASASSVPGATGPAYNKEMNKNPKTAIAAAAANDPEYDILDLSGNTMFLMKHRDYAKELGGALAGNTYIREVHLKSVDLDKVDVQSLMEGLVKNSTVVLLDLEKNKIDNEGAATLANMMRQNSTIREVNLFGQAGRAFGDACLTAFVDMFTYNVTLTKIIWRLDSRKSFAINKLLVRNNTIKKNLEEGRDVSKIVPVHCNIPDLLSRRVAGAPSAEEGVEALADEGAEGIVADNAVGGEANDNAANIDAPDSGSDRASDRTSSVVEESAADEQASGVPAETVTETVPAPVDTAAAVAAEPAAAAVTVAEVVVEGAASTSAPEEPISGLPKHIVIGGGERRGSISVASTKPYCFVCAKEIDGEVLNWDGKDFHDGCFKCTKCGKLPDESTAVKNIDGKPHCDACVAGIKMTSQTLQPLGLRMVPQGAGHKRNKSDSPALKKVENELRSSAGHFGASPSLKQQSSDRISSSSNSAGVLSPRMTGKLTGAQALLKWCQKRTDYKYHGVDLGNWKQAWQDGKGLCALAHHFFNDAVDFESLKADTREDKIANCALAFRVFNERGGVPQLLDPEDLVDILPEPRSVQTYVSEIRKRLDPQEGDSPLPSRVAPSSSLIGPKAEGKAEGLPCCKCKSTSNPPGYRECRKCGARQ